MSGNSLGRVNTEIFNLKCHSKVNNHLFSFFVSQVGHSTPSLSLTDLSGKEARELAVSFCSEL